MNVASGKKTAPRRASPDSSQAVAEFMAQLDHPCKAQVEAVRQIILGSDKSIAEGIKWNVPSFRTAEYFATFHLRAKEGIAVIFHLGAKVKEIPEGGIAVKDPAKLLKWLAKDRAIATFGDMEDVVASKAALQALVRQWITLIAVPVK